MDGSFLNVKLDGASRLVIPVSVRRALDIQAYDVLKLSFNGKYLKIYKEDPEAVDKSVKEIINIASDSPNITLGEYKELSRLLNKLIAEEAK